MTITVRATFAQEGVFFAGEKLNCTITFTNSAPSQSAPNGLLLPRQLQDLQAMEGNGNSHGPGQQPTNGNGIGNGHQVHQPLSQLSGHPSNALARDRASAFSPTSPTSNHSTLTSPFSSPMNADTRAQTRPTASLMHNVNAVSQPNGHGENGNRAQRPGTNANRTFSQGRVSTDISHIDAIPRDLPDLAGQGKPLPTVQDIEQTDQDDQEDQEQTNVVVPPPPTENSLDAAQGSPSSPTPRQQQQMLEQQEQLQSEPQGMSSPGLLGLASFVYRSASFSSLASAFGLSGNEPEPSRQYDEKKLPPLPPQEYRGAESRQSLTVLPPTKVMSPENEEEKTTKEHLQDHGEQDLKNQLETIDPEQLARMGTPIGLGLGSEQSNHSRTATGGSLSGLQERMIELQVTDNADTQSMADDGEYQTPRPSMDYSTRSSMQSIRGPFQQQYFQETPSRRSSLMSTYSTVSSPRHLFNQGTKKEALLWGSVQIVGQFMVDGSFIRQQGFEALKSKTMYRPTGSSGGGAIGGGTLGTVNSSDWRDRANANRLFPVFSTPPSILFVDLQLAPGESTSYTYQIELPADLPPSHRGKTIRFSYNLVLGVQRGSVHTPAKSVQLPFRLYNNISELGTRPVYDLMSPVILHKDTAISGVVGQTRTSEKTIDNPKLARRQFEDYVDELLRNIRPTEEEISPTHTRELTRRESDAYKDEEEVHSQTCLEKVALLSRSASSASYDICKNNIPVAKLSLIKTRFKLGETVHGVISFTSREIPTYQISVTLETVEVIEPSYACRSAVQTSKLTKRVHAELHESCIDTMRTSFSLCIPPTATPEFKTSTLTLKWYLRVEFITGPANQPRFKMTSVDERRSQYQAVEALSTESFDCSVPIQVYPTSYETGALFPPTLAFSLDK
ncbi:RAB6A-GEF complex partner protein 2 [Entomortierella parvispora]|uniref:RAB6A-GEF complex partner protein 2 n=1 Tax=Entomortierella parvispora TaxID=205924 RepID=A0A9P3LWX3_9FUNG|nr:RAB6A-GEF complex partner protein 2 [Entomortierella parvispora]